VSSCRTLVEVTRVMVGTAWLEADHVPTIGFRLGRPGWGLVGQDEPKRRDTVASRRDQLCCEMESVGSNGEMVLDAQLLNVQHEPGRSR